MGVFWVVGFPLFMAFMFGMMFGGMGKEGRAQSSAIPIALVDAEGSAASASFAKRLEASKDVRIERVPDVAQAKRAVLAGDVAAYVVLAGDFEGPGMFGGKPPRAEVGFAPTRRAEGGMLRGILMEQGAALLEESMGGGSPGGGGMRLEPVRIAATEVAAEEKGSGRPKPASSWEITFPSAILWGLIGCAATFALSLVTERNTGTWFRLKTAPLTRSHVLAGKGLACFVACSFVLAILLAVAVFAMGVRVQNAAGLLIAAACTAACFTGIMMFLSTLGRTEQAASGIGWGIMTVMAMLGGGMFPLFLMPPWMQTASNVSPVKWGILALEGAIWRGFTLSDMAGPCAVLLGVGAAGFAAGAIVLSRGDR
jgi:ABC-2 type transport system permease protein